MSTRVRVQVQALAPESPPVLAELHSIFTARPRVCNFCLPARTHAYTPATYARMRQARALAHTATEDMDIGEEAGAVSAKHHHAPPDHVARVLITRRRRLPTFSPYTRLQSETQKCTSGRAVPEVLCLRARGLRARTCACVWLRAL